MTCKLDVEATFGPLVERAQKDVVEFLGHKVRALTVYDCGDGSVRFEENGHPIAWMNKQDYERLKEKQK